jgi:transcriptional regulator of acetoin/glycerol metabolism
MEMLQQYDWPGNIAELAECVRTAARLCGAPVLSKIDFPEELAKPFSAPGVDRPPGFERRTLVDIERQAILDALALTGGNVPAAAKYLGVGKTTMYRRLRKYGVRQKVPDRRQDWRRSAI